MNTLPESAGLKWFRSLIPPFIEVEVVPEGGLGPNDSQERLAAFDSGQNFVEHINSLTSALVDDMVEQGAKDISNIQWDFGGHKFDLDMVKALVAQMAEDQDNDYLEGVKKVYLIHPPGLEEAILRHLSGLLVPAIPNSQSARLISVTVGDEMRHFVVEPYKMNLPTQDSKNVHWLIVHLYNPDKPAMSIKVEDQGPWAFKEPTPLLSDTEVAEDWAMKALEAHFIQEGIAVHDVCYEPNGPSTFPDYRACLDGTTWNFEITRVLGDMLETRHILDKPRDTEKMMRRAIQSPPIQDSDIRNAVDHAIKSKERKQPVDGAPSNLCLVLIDALDLGLGSKSTFWKDIDLSAFNAVVLVDGYPQPRLAFLKGRSLLGGEP